MPKFPEPEFDRLNLTEQLSTLYHGSTLILGAILTAHERNDRLETAMSELTEKLNDLKARLDADEAADAAALAEAQRLRDEAIVERDAALADDEADAARIAELEQEVADASALVDELLAKLPAEGQPEEPVEEPAPADPEAPAEPEDQAPVTDEPETTVDAPAEPQEPVQEPDVQQNPGGWV